MHTIYCHPRVRDRVAVAAIQSVPGTFMGVLGLEHIWRALPAFKVIAAASCVLSYDKQYTI